MVIIACFKSLIIIFPLKQNLCKNISQTYLSKQSHLPSFRPRPIGIGIPRRFYLPLFFLRGLSIVPATYSFFTCISHASYVNERDANGVLELRSTKLDYWLGAIWVSSIILKCDILWLILMIACISLILIKKVSKSFFILQNFEFIIKCIFSKMGNLIEAVISIN